MPIENEYEYQQEVDYINFKYESLISQSCELAKGFRLQGNRKESRRYFLLQDKLENRRHYEHERLEEKFLNENS